MKEDIEQTKNVGMNYHLNKPIEIDELYTTLLKYISKKIYISEKTVQEIDATDLPEFEYLDVAKGLNYLAGNKKLYLKLLNDFKNDYKDIKLDSLDDSFF